MVSDELKEAAGVARVAAEGDPLLTAEDRLERSDYAAAIDLARVAVAKSISNADRQQRIANVLGRAYTLRGLVALNKKDYPRAITDLEEALKAGADPTSFSDTLGLAQQLGFELHESIALTDSRAYDDSYRVFLSVLDLSRQVSEDLGIQFSADLAEAALTSGRYDEAYEGARATAEWARRSNTSPQSVVLNMLLVMHAALVLKGDDAGAQRSLNELNAYYGSFPKGFDNTWAYGGTLHYLDSARLNPSTKQKLQATIASIR